MSGENIEKRIEAPGPKRVLTLDGGGVRGLVTLGFLERIEEILRRRAPDPEKFRLCDYFDLIGGASTGAIIATLLSLGWRVEEIKALYHRLCPQVFKRSGLSMRSLLSSVGLMTRFDSARFSSEIDKAFRDVAEKANVDPESLTLGSKHLRTGLAIVAKRIDTGAVWVQTNIAGRKYWSPDDPYWWPQGESFHPNRDYSLKQVVRASASAPYFVEEVAIEVEPGAVGAFVDGGASPHNNPSREVFLMAALRPFEAEAGRNPFGLGWATGPENLLLISVGTGVYRNRISPEKYRAKTEVEKAIHALRSIISDGEQDAVTWMQALSEPRKPWRINGKIEAMQGMRITEEPLLSYQRFNAILEMDPLRELMGADWADHNLTEKKFEQLREFDLPFRTNLQRLDAIGVAAGARDVEEGDFPAAFDRVVS